MIDGVIKYNFDFVPTKPLAKAQWREIENVRERLYALKLIGEKDGIGYGNISQRLNKEQFVITGTQTGHLENLHDEHYSLIEAYDDRTFTLKSSGAIKPSSEALTHGTIYNLSPDIGAVIHIHSKKIWDFMLENNYLKTENVPYGSVEMIEEVNRLYLESNPLDNAKFVMSGHEEGVITFSKSLREAELVLYRIVADIMS